MTVLRDSLVYDSENWSADQPLPVVFSFVCLRPSFLGAVLSMMKVYLLLRHHLYCLRAKKGYFPFSSNTVELPVSDPP